LHPILIDFGPFALHTYGLAMAIAFALGIWLAMKRSEARGLGGQFALDLSVLILVSSLIGARFTYVVTHWDEYRAHPLDAISPIQHTGQIGIEGLVLLGGVAAAFLAAAWYVPRKKHSFLAVADIFMPSTALGIAIGRLGCFFNGCCFGLPTHLPWGVVFPSGSLAGSIFPDIAVQPTELYESAAMFLLFGFFLLYDRRRHPTGRETGIFLLVYGVWRFFNESQRWYEHEMIIFQTPFRFTVSQGLSAIMVILGIYLIVRSRTQKLKAKAA
jgi:phosphatidylglycerol:prolipoprotein diacylglycerol transferase